MSDASASILPRKIGNRAPNRAKSGFSPDMLRVFCDRAGDALGVVLDTRTRITLESVGLEPLSDVLPEEGSEICGALADLNGIKGAVTVLPDKAALFHLVDIMLGGDALEDEPILERPPSSLNDRFFEIVVDALIKALASACETTIGPGSCLYDGRIKVVHDGAELITAPADSDLLAVELSMTFGVSERRGKFSMLVPLTTIDAISGAGPGGVAQPAFESGPWFDHMKTSVSLMELETLALLHSERMSLAALSRLDVGSVITLNREAVSTVQIALEDGGDIIASGELGVSSGRRVICLDDAPNESFLAPLRKLVESDD